MLKADFHIHTREDRLDDWIKYNAKDLIKRAAKLGFDVLAITNHETFTYNEELVDYAKEKGILLISGIESSIEGGHVIILNSTKDIEDIKTFEELREYKENNPDIFVMAPHLFYPVFKSLKEKFFKYHKLFDGVEYSQHYLSFFNLFNKKAIKAAKKYNKSLVGTSDSHKMNLFNRTYSLIDAKKNIDSVIDTLKENKIKIKTRPLSIISFLKMSLTFLWVNGFRKFFAY